MDELRHRINYGIKVPTIRLLDEAGNQVGIVATNEALKKAKEQSLDLVEIAPTAKPPVCKILDYGKFIYDLKRQKKEEKRVQRSTSMELKEVQLASVIQENDLEIKMRKMSEILQEGNKVKVVVKFLGRNIRHTDIGRELFKRISAFLAEWSLEKVPNLEGKNMIAIFAPLKKKD